MAHLKALYANVEDADKKEVDASQNALPLPDMSAWGLTPELASSAGTLLTLFNGKIHEAMTCVTDQLTQRGYLNEIENKVLTDHKGATLKFFNENIPLDLAARRLDPLDLSAIASKELRLAEHSAQLVSSKELAGSPYDWVMITSSSYQDREGETISQKAHEEDIAWIERKGYGGTLDWWHLHPLVFELLESKERVQTLPPYIQKHGLILGDCKFAAMYGKLRIEAGTYRSAAIKEVMDANASELSGSLLFLHPKSEPDTEGVYHHIRSVSRAIMPKEKVSNLAALLSDATVGVN